MNCKDYLSMLATVSVGDLEHGSAREHAAVCADCERVTRVVAERERNMVIAFENLQSPVPAAHVATNGLVLARRRQVALYYKFGLALATVASGFYFVASRGSAGPPPVATVRESFRLQCLSPEQAGEILRPYMKSTGSITMRADSPLGIVSVEAPPEQMATARALIERYDNAAQSQCAVQIKIPQVP